MEAEKAFECNNWANAFTLGGCEGVSQELPRECENYGHRFRRRERRRSASVFARKWRSPRQRAYASEPCSLFFRNNPLVTAFLAAWKEISSANAASTSTRPSQSVPPNRSTTSRRCTPKLAFERILPRWTPDSRIRSTPQSLRRASLANTGPRLSGRHLQIIRGRCHLWRLRKTLCGSWRGCGRQRLCKSRRRTSA